MKVVPPFVDSAGYFFSGNTIVELAESIKNPYQTKTINGATLQETATRYNSFVDVGKDMDFGKPKPRYKIDQPPFYAAWATPMVHDTRTGLRINGRCQVVTSMDRLSPASTPEER